MTILGAFTGCFPKRSLLLLVFAGLLLSHACSQEPILIGFSANLTGTYSDLGVQGRNGASLALERINEEGGVAGRKLRLLARDDGNTAQQARQADRDLIANGVVAIIGHMTSAQSQAALPIAQGDVDMPVSILQIQNATFTTVSRIRTEIE